MTRRECDTPCCYCGSSKPAAGFTGREHVIPQAFGRFVPNLIARAVCDECNKAMGDELDIVLARGSHEGLLRFFVGDKPPTEYKHVGRRMRIETRAAAGPWQDMFLLHRPSPDGTSMMVEPERQIGFSRDESGPWDVYRADEVPTREDYVTANGPGPLFLRAMGFEADELREFLLAKGYQPDSLETDTTVVTDGTTVRCEHRIVVDRLLFRAIAKIAFNYLVARHEGLARMSQFAAVRDFVRWDREPGHRVLHMDTGSILANPDPTRLGHIVTLRHDPATGAIESMVSLYTRFRYRVTLSPTGFLVGVPREFMTSGHFFDVRTRKVVPLVHSSRLRGVG